MCHHFFKFRRRTTPSCSSPSVCLFLTLCRVFRFLRLSRPKALTISLVELETLNNRLNKMTLGLSGQFDEIHSDWRKREVLSRKITKAVFLNREHVDYTHIPRYLQTWLVPYVNYENAIRFGRALLGFLTTAIHLFRIYKDTLDEKGQARDTKVNVTL